MAQSLIAQSGFGNEAVLGDKHLSVFKKYEIVVLNGLTDIFYCQLTQSGKIDQSKDSEGNYKTLRSIQAPGRIIRIMNDGAYNNGLIMMTDEGSESLEYKEVHDC